MILNQYNVQSINRVFSGYVIAKRFRKYKPKWAINTGDKTPCDHALLFFDKYYPAAYGNSWSSIRLALLSLSKYCALVNNFSLNANNSAYFEHINAYDIVKYARLTVLKSNSTSAQTDHKADAPASVNLLASAEMARDSDPTLSSSTDQDNTRVIEVLCTERNRTASEDNLSTFMPVKKVVSQRDIMRNLEEQQNVTQPTGNFNVITNANWKLTLPSHLQAFTFDRGCIKVFKQAKPDAGGLLNYYLMDAASLLPVLALDLIPGCSVLDMCAAPGGKTIAMLQTLLPESVTCIDHSRSRLNRLKGVLSLYVPKSYINSEKVNVLHGCAIHFGHEARGKLSYDRVLVDVPCFADRHALHNEDNNMFRPSRLEERLQIQNTQRDLLVAGLLACKPGGSVVYSTCTLSMAQNDSVVRQALEQLWLKSSFDVAVVDTTPLVSAFSDVFTFHKCQLGHLVQPNVTANFGPMYFCKLQRLS